jgi:hypothetical protein
MIEWRKKEGSNMAATTDGKLKEGIKDKLSILTTRVKLETAVGHTDINHEVEDFYCGLLNAVFDWELSNLNALQMNFPAIDLADRKKRIAVQVTSTEGRKKVQDTLNRFFEKKLDEYFDRLIVLIIGKKPNSRSQFTLKGELDFDAKRDIWDTDALIKKIYALREGKLKAVAEYIEKQLPEQNKLKVTLGEDSAVVTELRGIHRTLETVVANSGTQMSCANSAQDNTGEKQAQMNLVERKKRIGEAPETVEDIIEPVVKAHECRCNGMIGDDGVDSLILEALRKMVDTYGTRDYFFNLAVDIFVERTAEILEDSLMRILEREIPPRYSRYFQHEDFCELFCAYYALSLIYKKKKEKLVKLRGLSAEKYQVFEREPLYHEVQSRILKRSDKEEDFHKALEEDSTAIEYLEDYEVENCAVGNSFASTVCMMLERELKVEADEIAKSMEYIDAAIIFNPEYPKYYFVKAQLLFYSTMLTELDLSELESTYLKIEHLITKAKSMLHKLYPLKSAHYQVERTRYIDLCNKAKIELENRRKTATPPKFYAISEEKRTALKSKILNSYRYDSCAAPNKPTLSTDDEYIYICYSPLDYKAVYCDLIELYRSKVPFQFAVMNSDETEANSQIEEHIGNPKCVGVVFYISNHSLVSPTFCDQIKMVYEKKKYLAVNLEGDCPPTKIAMDTVLSKCSKEKNEYPIKGTHLRLFLLAFDDNHKYIAKHRVHGEKGTEHIPYLKKEVMEKFCLAI